MWATLAVFVCVVMVFWTHATVEVKHGISAGGHLESSPPHLKAEFGEEQKGYATTNFMDRL